MPCDCFTGLFNRLSRVAPVEDAANTEAHASPEKNEMGKQVGSASPLKGLRNSNVDATDTCRYYCPLCMMYFECVFEAKCCGHTVCDECAMEFNKSVNKDVTATPTTGEATQADKDADASVACDAEQSIPLTPRKTSSQRLEVECPFCRHEGLEMKLITPGEAGNHLRNYDDSPAASREETPMRANAGRGMAKPSPLKVGDSFEKMKAKMVPFQGPPPGERPPLPPRSTGNIGKVASASENQGEDSLPHEVNATPMRDIGGQRLGLSTPRHEVSDDVSLLAPRLRQGADLAPSVPSEGDAAQSGRASTPIAEQNNYTDTPRQDQASAQPVTPGQDGDLPNTPINEAASIATPNRPAVEQHVVHQGNGQVIQAVA